MKYVVHAFTILIYSLACAAITYGAIQFGRAAFHLSAYEPVLAQPIYLPEDGYANYSLYGNEWCWPRYEYVVAEKKHAGPSGCAQPSWYDGIRVLYRRSNHAESIVDDISLLIASGIRWVAFGGVLGLWASVWRSRSVALNGRTSSGIRWGSGAWGFLALFGFTAAAARDIADTHEGFCGARRHVLSSSIARMVVDHERRFPREWLESVRENFDREAVLSGSPECLAADDLDELKEACAGGFHIAVEADIGSPVCDLSNESRYKADIEFLTDRKYQTVNVRFIETP